MVMADKVERALTAAQPLTKQHLGSSKAVWTGRKAALDKDGQREQRARPATAVLITSKHQSCQVFGAEVSDVSQEL